LPCAPPIDGIDVIIQAAGDTPIRLESSVPPSVAMSVATVLLEHPVLLAAGDLHIDLPERTARIFRVAPTAEDLASIHALFDQCRRTPQQPT
jgi:hypothetical protein